MKYRIKERRKELKMIQSQAAKKIGGVSRQYISKVEVNKGEIPSLMFANKISRELNSCVYSTIVYMPTYFRTFYSVVIVVIEYTIYVLRINPIIMNRKLVFKVK